MASTHYLFAQLGAALGILFALIEPFDRRNPRLGVIFFLGLAGVSGFMRHAFALDVLPNPYLYSYYVSSLLFVGPLTWLLAQRMFHDEPPRSQRFFMWHLLPALVVAFFESVAILGAPTIIYRDLMLAGVRAQPQISLYFVMFMYVHICVYLVWIFIPYFRVWRPLKLRYPPVIAFSVLFALWAAIVTLGLGFFLHIRPLYVASLYWLTFVMAYLLLLRIRYPDFLADLPDALVESRYQTTRLDSLDVPGLKKAIDNIMQGECIYRDDSLRIANVASRLGISTNQLSRLINEEYGQRFTDLVNGYRIREARELMLSPDLTILEIAYRVGFNNISTFNHQFKRIVQERPTDFRRRMTAQPKFAS